MRVSVRLISCVHALPWPGDNERMLSLYAAPDSRVHFPKNSNIKLHEFRDGCFKKG
jgi:hypothetical protein